MMVSLCKGEKKKMMKVKKVSLVLLLLVHPLYAEFCSCPPAALQQSHKNPPNGFAVDELQSYER
jgi:hypothetical protein